MVFESIKHFTFPTLFYKVENKREGRSDVGGSQKELLDAFLKLGYISSDAVHALNARAAKQGIAPVEAAILENLVHPDAKGWLLAEALGIPWLEFDPGSVPLSMAELVPELLARENLLAPVSRDNRRLTLAAVDPFRQDAFSSIRSMTGLEIRVVVSPLRSVEAILSRIYPDLLQLSPGDLSGGIVSASEAEKWVSQGGARRLMEKVLLHAASTGLASVRLSSAGRRVVLTGSGTAGNATLLSFPLRARSMLLEALAELAGAGEPAEPLSETVFQLESPAGVRAFCLCLVQGLSGTEAVVRILHDHQSSSTLDSVGLNPEQIRITRKVIAKGGGLYLLSSPGPEGMATTLFTLLREIQRPGDRVVTVEEHFRLRNEGYIQMERRDVARQFAGNWSQLAESLEPDALMIENITDPVDFSDLVHLAQTGVAVLCGMRRLNFDRTLRTLLSLDVDPFILSRVVRMVMHQRLVNLLCPECRRPVPAKPSLHVVGERYRAQLQAIVDEASFYMPSGCEKCRGTGYSGKMALVELLPFTPCVENLVSSDAWLDEKLGLLQQEDFYSALLSVQDLLRRGMVTYDDVLPLFR